MLEGYTYSNRLRILGLTTLETKFENVDPEKFFQVAGEDGKRGHSFKVFKKRYRLDVGRFKFASRVCEEWNRLDENIVAMGSVNARVVVLVLTSRSRMGLETYFSNVSVSGKSGMVSVSSWTKNQMSRSRLGSRA